MYNLVKTIHLYLLMLYYKCIIFIIIHIKKGGVYVANIGHIVVCDEVFTSPQGEVIIKKPLSLIVPPSLPTNYTFVIAIGLINLKANTTYKTIVKFISPVGDVILENNFELQLEEDKQFPNSIVAGGFNVNCRNIVLKDIGDYVVFVSIGDENKTLLLPVQLRES